MAWGAQAQTFDDNTTRVEWPELRALIAAGTPEHVLRRLAYTPAPDLAHLRPHLKTLRTQLRAALKTTDRADRTAHDEARGQLAPPLPRRYPLRGRPRRNPRLDHQPRPARRTMATP